MAISNSLLISKSSPLHLSSGSLLKSVDRYGTIIGPNKLSFGSEGTRKSSIPKRSLTVQAKYSDGPSNGSIFLGGFVLGGLIVGTLGCVYAPQISEVLAAAATEKEDLMKKLPKFKEQRQKLFDKIEQLHSAMDNISSQLQSDEPPSDQLPSDEPPIPKPPKFEKRSKKNRYPYDLEDSPFCA